MYVVGSLSSRHLSQMGCFSRSSSMSDGSRKQPMQARLSAADEGAPPSSAAGGAASSAAGRTAAALASLVPRGLRKGTNIWTTMARRRAQTSSKFCMNHQLIQLVKAVSQLIHFSCLAY